MSQVQEQKQCSSIYDRLIPELLSTIDLKRPEYMAMGLPTGLHLRECRTVRISAGRQTGKTSWIIRNARPGSVLIAQNNITRDSLSAELKRRHPNTEFVVAAMSSLLSDPIAVLGAPGLDNKVNSFIVDDASFAFEDEGSGTRFFEIIKNFAWDRTYVIMLG